MTLHVSAARDWLSSRAETRVGKGSIRAWPRRCASSMTTTGVLRWMVMSG
jgi:hypothetical protein